MSVCLCRAKYAKSEAGFIVSMVSETRQRWRDFKYWWRNLTGRDRLELTYFFVETKREDRRCMFVFKNEETVSPLGFLNHRLKTQRSRKARC
jgi:hypothetical protein